MRVVEVSHANYRGADIAVYARKGCIVRLKDGPLQRRQLGALNIGNATMMGRAVRTDNSERQAGLAIFVCLAVGGSSSSIIMLRRAGPMIISHAQRSVRFA